MINLTTINNLAARLQSLRPLNAGELARLWEEFVIDNTYNSNAIEGNSLTLRETAMILREGVTIAQKPLKDHLEAIGHRDAFDYVLTLVEAGAELTERIIKEAHSLVLINDARNRGIYRSIPVQILGSGHTPPQPYLIQSRMEQLLEDYSRSRETFAHYSGHIRVPRRL